MAYGGMNEDVFSKDFVNSKIISSKCRLWFYPYVPSFGLCHKADAVSSPRQDDVA